jgi:hypothetical protein
VVECVPLGGECILDTDCCTGYCSQDTFTCTGIIIE